MTNREELALTPKDNMVYDTKTCSWHKKDIEIAFKEIVKIYDRFEQNSELR